MLGRLRLDVVKLPVPALPAFAVKQLLVDWTIPIGGRSWSVAVLALPLLLAAWVVWQRRQRGRPEERGGWIVREPIAPTLAAAVPLGRRRGSAAP